MNESNNFFDKLQKEKQSRYDEITNFGREQDFDSQTEDIVYALSCQIKWIDEYSDFLLYLRKMLKIEKFYSATFPDSFEKCRKKIKIQAENFYNIKQNYHFGSIENLQREILHLAEIGVEGGLNKAIFKEETVFTNLKTYFNESKILSFNQFINESIENKSEDPLQILLNDFSQNDETAKITNIKFNKKELNVAYTDKIFNDKTPKMKSFNDNKKIFKVFNGNFEILQTDEFSYFIQDNIWYRWNFDNITSSFFL